jgi:sugar lactone lactonase YvrE
MESEHLCNQPAVIADYACETGENPLWVPEDQSLLWTDIPRGRLFRHKPATRITELIYSGRPVGGFTIQQDGSLLLFKDRGTITRWTPKHEAVIVPEIPMERELRFNDVIADPAGRVFCGTYTDGRKGRLYRLDADGTLTKILDDIGCSNGMAFTPDRAGFYYTDSFASTIYRFDYDGTTGEIRNQRIFYTVPEKQGLPDGCTVDEHGFLWFALWGGSAIIRLTPEGQVDAHIGMPAQKVTSLAFGGDDLKTIFVTSEGGNSRSNQDGLAGATFGVNCTVSGRLEFRSNVVGSLASSG